MSPEEREKCLGCWLGTREKLFVIGKAWRGVNASCLVDLCSGCSHVNVLLVILKNRQRALGQVVGWGWVKGFMNTQGGIGLGSLKHVCPFKSKLLMGYGPPDLFSLLSRRLLPVFPVGLVPTSEWGNSNVQWFCVSELLGVTQARQHSHTLAVLSWVLEDLGHPVTASNLLPGWLCFLHVSHPPPIMENRSSNAELWL